jgi:hypothetical protein
MGEILAGQVDKFNKFSTLTWENVIFLDKDEVLLYSIFHQQKQAQGVILLTFFHCQVTTAALWQP